ncbi:PorT family protein [Aquimarina algiphila]|uniref:PorT family protein n=1 Tax=Aquimarina algiphila TaxID=2047982 RepID=A0A554VNL1_9FLAO|nr:PorT family protein [Aquimarina algiphila]TSE09966.1 PorT family protein [Aquimarina algiphila]
MKTIVTIATFVAMTLFAQLLSAQETDKSDAVKELTEQKERIINTEKEALKKEVEVINERLINNEITRDEAQKLKEDAAENHALNIENRLAIIDNKIALLERNGLKNVNTEDPKIFIGLNTQEENADVILGLKINTGKERKIKYDIRTRSNLVIAFGLNNAIVDGQSLDDSDYKIAGSRFFEIGWAWKTRVFKNSNFLRFKYGISYTTNGLKPTDNRYFVENGDQTELEEFRVELKKSKFRMDNLVIPIHFEFGPSKVVETEKKIRYYTSNRFRIGIGGYAGVNVSTRQKLKYRENGDRVKDKIKRDYNTSDLIYGLSTYIGFGDMSLYLKYDLQPIFRNATVDQNNVSLGLRFDL